MTITMTYSTVSSEIETFIRTEIRVQESAVRTVDGSSHSRPWFLHAQSTSHIVFHHLFSLQIKMKKQKQMLIHESSQCNQAITIPFR